MKTLENRREILKEKQVELRKLKSINKELQRSLKFGWQDANKIENLKSEVRHLGIVHTIIKRRRDIEFNELSLKEFGLYKFKEMTIDLGIEKKESKELDLIKLSNALKDLT